ncbi:hypothetical protein Pfo_000260 [Paulownia fortunei]|nr:hypothetical protein Pfo_000260 [Paulownia fortunei]
MKLAPLNTVQNAHDDSVWTAAWVPATEDSEALLLTGSLDETVLLWNPEGPRRCRRTPVTASESYRSGRIAASASIDSFIRVFDVATNTTIATLEAPSSEVWQLQFNPQGTTLAAAAGGSASVKLWDTAEWKSIATLEVLRPEGLKPAEKSGNKKFALSVAWSPDGRQIACGSLDGTISVFDVAHAKFLHHLEGHCMPVWSLVYSSAPLDSRVLFSASDDGHVHVYDAVGKTLITSMSGHSSWVLSVDVSPDGAAIATGSSDKTVRLWDLKMRAATQILTSHTDQVWAVAFGPPLHTDVRSCLLASVSDDKSVSFYKYS